MKLIKSFKHKSYNTKELKKHVNKFGIDNQSLYIILTINNNNLFGDILLKNKLIYIQTQPILKS